MHGKPTSSRCDCSGAPLIRMNQTCDDGRSQARVARRLCKSNRPGSTRWVADQQQNSQHEAVVPVFVLTPRPPLTLQQFSARYDGVVQQLSESVQQGLRSKASALIAAGEVLAAAPADQPQLYSPRYMVRNPAHLSPRAQTGHLRPITPVR